MGIKRKVKLGKDGGVEIQHFDDGGQVQQIGTGTTFDGKTIGAGGVGAAMQGAQTQQLQNNLAKPLGGVMTAQPDTSLYQAMNKPMLGGLMSAMGQGGAQGGGLANQGIAQGGGLAAALQNQQALAPQQAQQAVPTAVAQPMVAVKPTLQEGQGATYTNAAPGQSGLTNQQAQAMSSGGMAGSKRKIKLSADGGVEIHHDEGSGQPEHFANGGAAATGALSGAASGAALGSVIPGIGTVIGGIGGALVGGLAGLFSSDGPKPPNLVDPVTGEQLTDADGRVVASQEAINGFTERAKAQDGMAKQSDLYGQYGALARGEGPSVGQSTLNNATGQNVATQASLMAGQRGASANPALIARQAALTGAATQQQAVGQGATLRAGEQLAAMGAQTGLAGQMVGNEQAGLGMASEAAAARQAALLKAKGQYNDAQAGIYGTDKGAETAGKHDLLTMAGNGLSATGAAIAKNASSTTPQAKAYGGSIDDPKLTKVPAEDRYSHFKGISDIYHPQGFAHGGEVDKKAIAMKKLMDKGGTVPGKAKVKGDHPKNDTVPAVLSPGEVVLPRSVLQSDDPVGNSAKFVAALLAKHGKSDKMDKGSKEHEDFKKALGSAIKSRKK